MVGNETYLASRAILGSDAHLTNLGKLIQFEQIRSLACTQQKGNFSPEILDEFSEIEERSHTYATTYEQIFLALPGRHGEAVAERQHTVKHVALLELSELTGTVAHHCYEQPELIIFTIHEIDGDRTTKHGSRRMVYSYFYELARQDFRQRFLIGKLNQNVLIAKRLYRNHLQVENIFFHLIANF